MALLRLVAVWLKLANKKLSGLGLKIEDSGHYNRQKVSEA
jgi:hypothetical protein